MARQLRSPNRTRLEVAGAARRRDWRGFRGTPGAENDGVGVGPRQARTWAFLTVAGHGSGVGDGVRKASRRAPFRAGPTVSRRAVSDRAIRSGCTPRAEHHRRRHCDRFEMGRRCFALGLVALEFLFLADSQGTPRPARCDRALADRATTSPDRRREKHPCAQPAVPSCVPHAKRTRLPRRELGRPLASPTTLAVGDGAGWRNER